MNKREVVFSIGLTTEDTCDQRNKINYKSVSMKRDLAHVQMVQQSREHNSKLATHWQFKTRLQTEFSYNFVQKLV